METSERGTAADEPREIREPEVHETHDEVRTESRPRRTAERKKKAKDFSKAQSSSRGPGMLEVASFTCGAAVMVLEMAGSRVVAPYMGTSLIVWTSLIGVIMASLSAGYWLGGIAADLRPERKLLARIILLSSLFTGLLALLSNPVLDFLASAFRGGGYVSSILASVLAALALFAVPSLLLGMVSPFIVRLAMKDVGSSGATIGRFSALSTAGSILGTFLGGLVLISFFASGTILLIVAFVLAVLALLLYRSVWKKAILLVILFPALAVATRVWGMPMAQVGEHIETPYNHIWIAESMRASGRRVRVMATDPDGAQSVMYTDNPTELVSDYTKFYDLAFYYRPETKRILMLGGGGYCVPRHVMAERQGISMDVVEIDPGITAAARRYFHLQDYPGLTVRHEDARVFLNRAVKQPGVPGSYDAIFEDVFGSSYSIPFHLATVETAERMYELLAPGGVLVTNVISALYGPKSYVFHGIYASIASVFPRVLIFPATRSEPQFAQTRQNIMIVAFKSEDLPAVPPSPDPEILPLLAHRWKETFRPEIPPFTDAFAPVERYSLMQ